MLLLISSQKLWILHSLFYYNFSLQFFNSIFAHHHNLLRKFQISHSSIVQEIIICSKRRDTLKLNIYVRPIHLNARVDASKMIAIYFQYASKSVNHRLKRVKWCMHNFWRVDPGWSVLPTFWRACAQFSINVDIFHYTHCMFTIHVSKYHRTMSTCLLKNTILVQYHCHFFFL